MDKFKIVALTNEKLDWKLPSYCELIENKLETPIFDGDDLDRGWLHTETKKISQRYGNRIDAVMFFVPSYGVAVKRFGRKYGGFINDYQVGVTRAYRYQTAEHELLHMFEDLVKVYLGYSLSTVFKVDSFDTDVVHGDHDDYREYDYDEVFKRCEPYVLGAVKKRREEYKSYLNQIIFLYRKIIQIVKDKDIMETPQIKKRHVPNYWPNNNPKAIVWHTLRGSLWGSLAWLNQIKLSYNYIIAKNGDIYELVPPEKGAFHAGIYRNPNQKAIDLFGWKNPNLQSIGIAFERNGESRLTNQQVLSARFLRDKLDLPHEIAHVDISSNKPQEVLKYMQQI